MKARFFLLCLSAALLAAVPAAQAAPAPAWQLSISPLPGNFAPGEDSEYLLIATNTGADASSGAICL